jgi:hypothetical protein
LLSRSKNNNCVCRKYFAKISTTTTTRGAACAVQHPKTTTFLKKKENHFGAFYPIKKVRNEESLHVGG